jgi:hypothetical protein
MCLFDLSTAQLSESHRKLVKNVDFSKQMFPGINKKEQDRVRARFSMDVTKRCSAEIKQAHKQWAILRAHLSAEGLSFPITSVRSKFAVRIPR